MDASSTGLSDAEIAAGLEAGEPDTAGFGGGAAAGMGDVDSGVVHATSVASNGINTKRRISLFESELECTTRFGGSSPSPPTFAKPFRPSLNISLRA